MSGKQCLPNEQARRHPFTGSWMPGPIRVLHGKPGPPKEKKCLFPFQETSYGRQSWPFSSASLLNLFNLSLWFPLKMLIFNYMSMCVCVWLCMQEHRCLWRPKEDASFHCSGVKGSVSCWTRCWRLGSLDRAAYPLSH